MGGLKLDRNIFIRSEYAPACRINCSMCMVVSKKCKGEWIISWKLCKSKTEGIFGRNMGTMGVMVEDVFLDVHGHISHTILCNMARMSTAETDTISVLCVAPVKIVI